MVQLEIYIHLRSLYKILSFLQEILTDRRNYILLRNYLKIKYLKKLY